MKTPVWATAWLLAGLAISANAAAAMPADPRSCRTVRVAEPGWSDIAATDALLGAALDRIGDTEQVSTLAVPIIFQGLANGRLDVFLGNWMPAQTHFAASPIAAHQIERVRANLQRARFTLAVPDYVASLGVHDIADLARFADRFKHSIYGIDPGAPADENLRRLIASGEDGLSSWRLVESSEFGMRSQLKREVDRHAWIVFLAWEPNPMNLQANLVYLSGGARFMGPDYGSSTIYTLSRASLSKDCPKLGQLLRNLSFSTGVETEMMVAMTQHHQSGPDAARAILAEHPGLMRSWLQNL